MVSMTSGSAWTALIPVKRLDLAKTRLRRLDRGSELDQISFNQKPSSELARAFARDVILSGLGAERVEAVVVVAADDDVLDESIDSAHLLRETASSSPDGLNAALVQGLQSIPGKNVMILTGDLAAVQSSSIDALARVAPTDRPTFVSDHQEIGTSVLLLPAGVTLTPQFGERSTSAHADAGCTDLTVYASADLRLDIDTMSDLNAAIELGVGPHTQAALSALTAYATK